MTCPDLKPGILRGAKVLVVDDEPETLATIATVLGLCGAEVKTTSSCEEAKTYLSVWLPHVLLAAHPELSFGPRPPTESVALSKPIEPVDLVTTITRLVNHAA